MDDPDRDDDVHLLWVGILVEGGLIGIALFLSWFGLYDHEQRLAEFLQDDILKMIGWGVVATIPLLFYLLLFHFWRPTFFQPMRDFVAQRLHPLFRKSSLLEMAILSLLAGLGEELLFRWSLQGGLTSVLEPQAGVVIATSIGLLIASILFGLCHWVNRTYGITTLIVGIYLGGLMIWSGSVLVPMVAHALFDFVAMIYIARSVPVSDESD